MRGAVGRCSDACDRERRTPASHNLHARQRSFPWGAPQRIRQRKRDSARLFPPETAPGPCGEQIAPVKIIPSPLDQQKGRKNSRIRSSCRPHFPHPERRLHPTTSPRSIPRHRMNTFQPQHDLRSGSGGSRPNHRKLDPTRNTLASTTGSSALRNGQTQETVTAILPKHARAQRGHQSMFAYSARKNTAKIIPEYRHGNPHISIHLRQRRTARLVHDTGDKIGDKQRKSGSRTS